MRRNSPSSLCILELSLNPSGRQCSPILRQRLDRHLRFVRPKYRAQGTLQRSEIVRRPPIVVVFAAPGLGALLLLS